MTDEEQAEAERINAGLIVERLRLRAQGRTTETAVLCVDAAHEIERLRTERDERQAFIDKQAQWIETFRSALKEIRYKAVAGRLDEKDIVAIVDSVVLSRD